MLKKYLPTIIITSVIILLPMIFGVVIGGRLPDTVPSHFNAAGEVDGYMSKNVLVFVIPLLLLLAHIICIAFTLADPKRKNIDGKPFTLILWVIPAVSLLTLGSVYLYALGYKLNVAAISFAMSGILFMIIGNYLPKCGHNYTLGIKTPWALNDEDNWRATHRFGGKIFVAAGVVMVILAFFTTATKAAMWIDIAVIILAAAAPEIYSYVYYLKHRKKED